MEPLALARTHLARYVYAASELTRARLAGRLSPMHERELQADAAGAVDVARTAALVAIAEALAALAVTGPSAGEALR